MLTTQPSIAAIIKKWKKHGTRVAVFYQLQVVSSLMRDAKFIVSLYLFVCVCLFDFVKKSTLYDHG